MVETVEAGGNDVLNPLAEKKLCSVVQTSVEVTEPSLQRVGPLLQQTCNTHKRSSGQIQLTYVMFKKF